MSASRSVHTVVVALILTLTASPNPFRPSSSVAAAQVSDSLPAGLLAQIADVASRFRTGRVAFVVYCVSPPRVVSIVDAVPTARTLVSTVGAGCGMMPVRTAAPDTAPAVSAALTRVLAEAADGFRTGQPVWYVAQDSFPYQPLQGPFLSYGVAQDSALRCLASGCRVHGPFVGIPDGGLQPVSVGCYHTPRTTYVCDPVPPFDVGRLDSLTLTYFPSAGEPVTLRWGTWEVDAIFLTQAAIDKFALPYYVRLYGAAFAAELLRVPR